MKTQTMLVIALCAAIGQITVQPARAQEKDKRDDAAPTTRKSVTFVTHGYGSVAVASFGPLKTEFEKRGFPCIIVQTPPIETKTPNHDRAQDVVNALRDVKGDVALLGVSNQGLFLPLVAAQRPVRRIVFINALIPRPGKSYAQVLKTEQVFTSTWLTKYSLMFYGISEVCPLKELPKCEYIYISAEKDEAIRPQWQQWAARTLLHVEPVIVKGASHGKIVFTNPREIVDAAVKGLE